MSLLSAIVPVTLSETIVRPSTAEIKQLDAALEPWTRNDCHGKKRVDTDSNAFTIKWVCKDVSVIALVNNIDGWLSCL